MITLKQPADLDAAARAELPANMLAYELLAALIAVRQRDQRPGDGVAALVDYFEPVIAPLERDRSPAPDVETILEHFSAADFIRLSR